MGAVPVVKTDVKAIQVRFTSGRNIGDELLRRFARLFGSNHDGRAVRVVRTAKVHRMALHALEPHPDIGLDVLHDVTDVEIAVGVGQRSGDEELAGHGYKTFLRQLPILVGSIRGS